MVGGGIAATDAHAHLLILVVSSHQGITLFTSVVKGGIASQHSIHLLNGIANIAVRIGQGASNLRIRSAYVAKMHRVALTAQARAVSPLKELRTRCSSTSCSGLSYAAPPTARRLRGVPGESPERLV